MEPHLLLCLPVFIKFRRAFCDSGWTGEEQLYMESQEQQWQQQQQQQSAPP
jgi:hypothetical protein